MCIAWCDKGMLFSVFDVERNKGCQREFSGSVAVDGVKGCSSAQLDHCFQLIFN